MAETGRIQPNSLEAERSVLGSMLLSEQCMLDGLEWLKVDDFYEPRHREIFTCMQELFNMGTAVDYVTVTEHLEKKVNRPGGHAEYLAELTSDVPSTVNFDYYKNIIREKSVLRSVIKVGLDMADNAFKENGDAEDIIGKAGDDIYNVATRESRRSLMSMKDAVADSLESVKKAMESKDGLLGVPTGFPTLDRMLSGLQGGQMIVVAGRPGMGKTSFALNIVEYLGVTRHIPCIVFSLEMSAGQLAGRINSSWARVDAQKYRNGKLTAKELEKLKEAGKELSEAPIYVDDSTAISITEMVAKARKLKAQMGLGLIVIDYLQLMTSNERSDNRQTEVAGLSRSVKIMAKELDVPVLLVSQLSRANEKRERSSRRPMLSDLRESGAIEQDADVVIFLHRDDYYGVTDLDAIGTAEIIVAKQRSGPMGTVNAAWKPEFTRYEEIDNIHTEDVFGSSEPPQEESPF